MKQHEPSPQSSVPERPTVGGTLAPRTVVTGGTRGIGAAVSRLLLDEELLEHEVIALGRGRPAAPPPWAEGRQRLVLDGADVRDLEATRAAFARANPDDRGLTGLVVSAGAWEPTPFATAELDRSLATFRRLIDVNLMGAVHCVAAFLEHVRDTAPASIVLVGSTAGQRGESGYAGYAASKAALAGLAKSWGVELADRGIRVNVVAPGWVDTAMAAPSLDDPETRRAIEATIPRGRVASAEDVAGPIAFLLSPASVHVTASVLSVNGGGVLASF